jgi:hypothetical protein
MINGDPIHVKNVGKLIRGVSLKTQEKTMSALSDPMMTTLFVESVEYMDRLGA